MNSSLALSGEVFHGLVPIERGLLWDIERYEHDGDRGSGP